MSLRVKIVLLLAMLAAAATVAIGVASYRSTSQELQQIVDRSLDDAARRMTEHAPSETPDYDNDNGSGGGPERPRSFEQVLVEIIGNDGTVLWQPTSGALPVSDADTAVAASTDPNASARHEFRLEGERFRVLTVKYGAGAVILARSLGESEAATSQILRSTLVAVVVVTAITLFLGWLIARQITARLERLTAVAGTVGTTGRLDVDVPVEGSDETGQLGRAFSGMLGALQRSREEQHQLVQDAGHELRTPLTSLRTNVAVLRRRFDRLPPDTRDQLLADLDSETRELTDLVNELVELATDRRDDEVVQPVRLADVAERAAARARRRFGRQITVHADDSLLDGRPSALERATQNLVDNACKFAPDGAIEVTVQGGRLTVRDHGPGLTAGDIPHLFDRFFRSVEMRSKPGSGLGLSIVKSIVDAHGGTVFARNAAGGGAEIGFTLPTPSAP